MITVVVGGQYGGEGKGKICSYLGLIDRPDVVCRTGGVNSSHTVLWSGEEFRLRMMPASVVTESASLVVFGAGSLIHIPTLRSEAETLGFPFSRIAVDPRAGIVTEECVAAQRADLRYRELGSTLTGTGYASARRCTRELRLAGEYAELRSNWADIPSVLYNAARSGKRILVEGHQGAGLSNYHGDYPFSSSRDCTAAALLSELGLGFGHNLETVLVVKLFPTRNHAGALPHEISREDARNLGIIEKGGGSWGVLDRERRVGTLDYQDIERAIVLNTPSYLAITGLDYLFPEAACVRESADLSKGAIEFLCKLEDTLKISIGLVSVGPDAEATIPIADTFVNRAAVARFRSPRSRLMSWVDQNLPRRETF